MSITGKMRGLFGGPGFRPAMVTALLAVFAAALPAHAVVYVVPGGAGSQDGTSWANAMGSIQAAVNAAAAVQPGGDEIWAAAGVYNEPATVVWASNVRAYGGFTAGDTLFSQRNPSVNTTTISGGNTHRVISMNTLVNVRLDGFNISGGRSAAPGAGIYCLSMEGTSRIANCVISNNTTTGAVDGGGLYMDQCNGFLVTGCTFSSNAGGTATGAGIRGGGGAALRNSASTVENCAFTGNTTHGNGGGLLASGAGTTSAAVINNCVFTSNQAGSAGNNRYGGGICVEDGAAPFVLRCAFTTNSTNYTGGAIAVATNAYPDVRDSRFNSNSSTGYGGGALYVQGAGSGAATTFFRRCVFNGNTNTQYGGAGCIFGDNGQNIQLNQCTFTNNSSPYGGGLFLLGSNNNVSMTGCSFQSNTSTGGPASHGGAIYMQQSGTRLTAAKCYFIGNTANLYGGALFTETQAQANLTNCVFKDNTANGSLGGAILFNGAGLASANTVMNCSFNGNRALGAGGGGGAIRNWTGTAGSPTLITNSVLWGDTSAAGGQEIDSSGTTPGVVTVTYCAVQGGYAGTGNINPGATTPYVATGAATLRIVSTVSATMPRDKGTGTGAPADDVVGTARPQGASVDMGAYEYKSSATTPTVTSINRLTPTTTPTNAQAVQFQAVFSESVARVSAANFTLATTGFTSAPSIVNVYGLNNIATITVDTGAGNGTIRCDYAPASGSPADANNNVPPLYNNGQTFTIDKSAAAAPVITSPNSGNDFSTSDAPLVLGGTCAAETSAILVNGLAAGVTYTPGGTTWTYTTTLTMPFANVFNVTARNQAGNESASDGITVTFNRAPTHIVLTGDTVVENAAPDTVVGTLATVDPDAGDTFAYSILSGGADFNVNLNGLVWELRTSRPFDFETEPVLTVTVLTQDMGGTGLTYFETLTVNVLDADEIAPQVVSVAVAGPREVDITFNEAMGAGVVTPANYALSGSGRGSLAASPDGVALSAGNTYRLSWLAGEMFNGGDITVTAANAQDAAGNPVGAPASGTDAGAGIGVPPVITRLGTDPLTVLCGVAYTDAGATALDNVDGDLTANITTVNPVNPALSNTYTVTYNVSDAAGNAAAQVTRTVTVDADTVKPVITRGGAASVTVECGAVYSDAGATALDNCGGDLTAGIVTVNPVNTAVPNVYTVTYNVNDGNGNSADQVTRTVTVQDTAKPVILLNGAASVTAECGAVYSDAGATASDACAGDLTAQLSAVSTVNTAVPGVYAVTYTVGDGNGNNAVPVVRTVTVQDTAKPVITLNGAASVTVECGAVYNDAGATASDACAGNRTANIVTVNPVNTAVPNVYTVTYNVNDGNGNNAVPVARTVTVQDTTGPVITVQAPAVEYVGQGAAYTPPAYSALDACGGADYTGAVVVTGTVDTGTLGTYVLNYTVTDGANIGTATHTVVVEPVSTLALAAVAAHVNAVEGTEARLEVTATGNVGPVLYQWYKESSGKALDPVDDATAAALVLNPVADTDAGVYVCVGTDHQKSAQSPEITLTVEPPIPAATLAGLAGLVAALGLGGALRARRRR